MKNAFLLLSGITLSLFILLILGSYFAAFKIIKTNTGFDNGSFFLSLLTLLGLIILIIIFFMHGSRIIRESITAYQGILIKEMNAEERKELITDQKKKDLSIENEKLKEQVKELQANSLSWKDKKELLLKWIEAGRPSEGEQQKELWKVFGKQLKEIIKDINDK